jgi:[acyl-carrier-protein] S-malonyltransferase
MDFVAAFPGGGSTLNGRVSIKSGAGRSILEVGNRLLDLDITGSMASGAIGCHPAVLPPALLVLCIAQLRDLQHDGYKFAAVVGHSAGDWTAAAAAGAICLEDAVRILIRRGELIEALCGLSQAAMLLVIGPAPEAVAEMVATRSDVWVAARNGRRSTTLSVLSKSTEDVSAALIGQGALAVKALPIPFGSHCPLMDPVVDALAAEIADIAVTTPVLPLYSSVTAAAITDAAGVRSALARNLHTQVRWDDTVSALLRASDAPFVGLGPGQGVGTLLREGGVPRARIHEAETLGSRQQSVPAKAMS